MKLERILERGLPLESETLSREEGDRPRGSLSSLSAVALFSKSDRRFRTAEEDRCSVMAVWEEEGSNQLEHFALSPAVTLNVRNRKTGVGGGREENVERRRSRRQRGAQHLQLSV
jgi:hypothetical protein